MEAVSVTQCRAVSALNTAGQLVELPKCRKINLVRHRGHFVANLLIQLKGGCLERRRSDASIRCRDSYFLYPSCAKRPASQLYLVKEAFVILENHDKHITLLLPLLRLDRECYRKG